MGLKRQVSEGNEGGRTGRTANSRLEGVNLCKTNPLTSVLSPWERKIGKGGGAMR
jgi:hypothetical protein